MLEFAWLTLRQAEEALKNGRLDEAFQLLSRPAVQGHMRSYELCKLLAEGLAARGERRLGDNDAEAAWHDLLRAEQLGSSENVARLRQAISQAGIAEVRALLEVGEPAKAREALDVLAEHGVRNPQLRQWTEATQAWILAREEAERGDFASALHNMEQAKRLTPFVAILDESCKDLDQHRKMLPGLLLRLHEAVSETRWRDVLQTADEILAVAPHHEMARKARNRAWKAIEPPTQTYAEVHPVKIARASVEPPASDRLMLWIDGIGGFLICLDNRVSFGQACAESEADIPLYADVSRLHAFLSRDPEGYLLEALRPVEINGETREKTWLRTGDRITLGKSCQLQFQQPAATSASARLDILSGHRLSYAVDGILLMADTLILGPGKNVHVNLEELTQSVILYRQPGGLGVRCQGEFTVDGQHCRERGALKRHSTVAGADFRFALEPVPSVVLHADS